MEKTVELSDVGIYKAVYARFWNSAIDCPHFRFLGRESQAKVEDVIKGFEITDSYTNGTGTQIFAMQLQGCIGLLSTNNQSDSYELYLASKSLVALTKAIKDFDSRIPPMPPADTDTVSMRFWMADPMGNASSRTRRIAIQPWDEIAYNYPGKTRDSITQIMNLPSRMLTNARLLLLHGKPGLGKTYTLRALSHAWNKWADVNYIVDPERFFDDAWYLMSVLFNVEYPEQEGRWQLFIVEDADEFIRTDAKERKGQALSRLLNVTDGIVGQGLNVMILITTNEPLHGIHPAIQREGRCLANIEFETFTKAEAEVWLKEHGVEKENYKLNPDTSLAELFNLIEPEHIRSLHPRPAPGYV